MQKLNLIFKTLFIVALLCGAGIAQAQTRITLDLNGASTTTSYTLLPYCFMQNVTAELWGGGGGGGGAKAEGWGNYKAAAGGGGSGAYLLSNLGNPNSEISISIGYGGAYGNGNQGGSSGGNTRIAIGSTYVQANGGGGGTGAYRNSTGTSAECGGGGGSRDGNVAYSGNDGGGGSCGGVTGVSPYGGNGGTAPNIGAAGTGSATGTGQGKTDGGGGTAPGGGGAGAAAYILCCNQSQTGHGGKGGDGKAKLQFDFVIPNITLNKATSDFCTGSSDVISVNSSVCSGSTYQWYKDGGVMSGKTSSSLTVTEAGTYYCIVTKSITKANLATELNVPESSITATSVFPITSSKQSGNCVVTVLGGGAPYKDGEIGNTASTAYEDVCPTASSVMVTWASLVDRNNTNLKWYADATGGSEIPEPAAFDASVDFSATYWVSQTLDGCESARTRVNVNINELPVPNIIPFETCKTTGVKSWSEVVFPESHETVHWYDDLTNANTDWANGSHTNALASLPDVDLSVVGTTTVWVILERTETGCHSVVSSATIIVKPMPEQIENYSKTICAGENIDYQPSTDLTYSYNDVANAASVSLTNVTQPQNFNVTAKNASGCDVIFNVNIIVNQPTSQVINAEICAGGDYTENDFSFSDVQEDIHTSHETTNANGCTHTVYLNLTVVALPSKTDAEITICSEGNIEFTPEDNVTYTFTPRDNEIGAEATTDITNVTLINTMGELKIVTYDVVQQNSLGCAGEPFTFTVNVNHEEDDKRTITPVTVVVHRESNSATITWRNDPTALHFWVDVYETEHELVDGIYVEKEELIRKDSIQVIGTHSYTEQRLDFTTHSYRFVVIAEYECYEDSEEAVSAILRGGTIDNPTVVPHIYIDPSKLNIWTSNGTLYIRNNNTGTGAVTIFNVIGKPISTLQILSGETRSIALPQGIYMLKAGGKAVKITL